MLKHQSLAIAIAVLLSMPQCLWAQKSNDVEVDTVKVNFINGVAVHADLIGAVQMATSDHGQWEAGLRINIKDKYFPAFEIGLGKADESDEYVDESWCKTQAPYFRIGCDFNILRNKHDLYKAFVGLRYGFSKFEYDTTVKVETESSEGESVVSYEEHDGLDATCHWMEAVFGVDAKVWGPLHLGWDIRYRRMLSNKHSDVAEPWYIPGFGNNRTAGFTASFNLTFAI